METLYHLRNQLLSEASQTAIVIPNNMVSQQEAMSPDHQFFGKLRTIILNKIQRFGYI